MQAVDDRREHRVDGGKTSEQEGSAAAEGRAGVRPCCFDARNIGPNLIAQAGLP